MTITLKYKPQILIPVRAVITENGNTFVNVIDKTTKQIKKTPVVTGITTKDSVVIVSGLNSGDQIVVPNQAQSSK